VRPKVGVGAATTAAEAGAPCADAALAARSSPHLEPKPLAPKPLEPQMRAAGARLGPPRLVGGVEKDAPRLVARGGMLGSSAEVTPEAALTPTVTLSLTLSLTLALTLALTLTLTQTQTLTLPSRAWRRAAWVSSRAARSWSARCRSSHSGRSTCAR